MFVMDANTASESMRPELAPAVVAWIAERDAQEMYLTAVGQMDRRPSSISPTLQHYLESLQGIPARETPLPDLPRPSRRVRCRPWAAGLSGKTGIVRGTAKKWSGSPGRQSGHAGRH